MKNYYVNEIMNIINVNGCVSMENYKVDILFSKMFGCELGNYNFRKVAELGYINIKEGLNIVELLEEGCIIKQDGIGEEYDLVVMDYGDLSERLQLTILMYLYSIMK